MEIKGSVVSIEIDVQVAKTGGGTYPGARFAYRDLEGKMVEKGFHNNVFKFNSSLKTQLSNLKAGDNFTAVAEKEGDYWNWKSITIDNTVSSKPTNDTPATGKATPYQSPKSTYETPEERAKKQVIIVRQSSIASAIALKGNKATVEEIISIAKQFESYALGIDYDDGSLLSMKEDTDGII